MLKKNIWFFLIEIGDERRDQLKNHFSPETIYIIMNRKNKFRQPCILWCPPNGQTREIVYYRYIKEMSIDEISKTDMNYQSVSNSIQRALGRIRNYLRENKRRIISLFSCPSKKISKKVWKSEYKMKVQLLFICKDNENDELRTKHTDFSYTFEEFLQNDFLFLPWIIQQKKQEFWDEFEQMNPSNIDEYIAGKRYLKRFLRRWFAFKRGTDDLWTRYPDNKYKNEKAKNVKLFSNRIELNCSQCSYFGGMFLFLLKNYSSVLDPILPFAVNTKDRIASDGRNTVDFGEDKVVVSLKEKKRRLRMIP